MQVVSVLILVLTVLVQNLTGRGKDEHVPSLLHLICSGKKGSHGNKEEVKVTWQLVAKRLDRACFIMMMIFAVIASLAFILALVFS